jgi:DNA-binding NarL/FixJ family response regulator
LLSYIEAGADGYLLMSEITPETLLHCLEVVVLGGVVIPRGSTSTREEEAAFLYDASTLTEGAPASAAAPRLMQDPAQPEQSSYREQTILREMRLSNREQTILKELMQGASNKHIARCLDIAEATVKVHVKSLLRKLRVTNRTQAAMWATTHFHEVPDSIMPASGITEEPEDYSEHHDTKASEAVPCSQRTRVATPPDEGEAAVDYVSVNATSRQMATGERDSTNPNGAKITIQASCESRGKDEQYRGLTNVGIATSRPESLSPLVTEVVRYLRQQDDVVVHQGNGVFLVNGRFRFETSELVDKANRIRQRQNKPLFIQERSFPLS